MMTIKVNFLRCVTVDSGMNFKTFRKNRLPQSLRKNMNMEAEHSAETSVDVYPTT